MVRLDKPSPAAPITGSAVEVASFAAKVADARESLLFASLHELAVPLARLVEACQEPPFFCFGNIRVIARNIFGSI
jgi:hypothetical protein